MGSNLGKRGTVVLCKSILDPELTGDPEGDRICCVLLDKKLSRAQKESGLFCPQICSNLYLSVSRVNYSEDGVCAAAGARQPGGCGERCASQHWPLAHLWWIHC